MLAATGFTRPRSRQTPPDAAAGRRSLVLHIAADGMRGYRARMFDGSEQVDSATCHATLGEAIRWYGQNAPLPGIDAFRIWYGGWCAGSFERARMECEADEIADRLLVLALVER